MGSRSRRLLNQSTHSRVANSTASVYGLYGFAIEAPIALCDDPLGDHLDALLCAVEAAWAWQNRAHGFGVPTDLDPLEGWIADPPLAPPRTSGSIS
jgi:hypothetical protein